MNDCRARYKVKGGNLEQRVIWNSQAKGCVSTTSYIHYFSSVLSPVKGEFGSSKDGWVT